MQLIELEQGGERWHAHRATHFNASEAAAALGVCPYKTREQLLREKKTGIAPEVSEHQQFIFDQGHHIEAIARQHAEQLIGKELFPCVGVLEGTKLSASFDGLTMDESTVFECKSINQTLRQIFSQDGTDHKDLPLHYRVQMEQQLLVSGADKALFIAANLNENGLIDECIECLYTTDPELRQRILHGWQQFEKDLEAYEVKEHAAPVIGQTPQALNALPVLHLAATGQLLASNLSDFKEKALTALAQINTDLQTDQDFADAESAAKECKDIESRLGLVKESLYVQAGIAFVIDEVNHIQGRFKNTRLALDKTIKHKKDQLKQLHIEGAAARVTGYIKGLNHDLPDAYRIEIPPRLNSELASAIKGLKTLSSMQNALDSVVLRYESDANNQYQCKQEQVRLVALHDEYYKIDEMKKSAELLGKVNEVIHPLSVNLEGYLCPLIEEAVKANDWPAIKQALINHIEQAIPA